MVKKANQLRKFTHMTLIIDSIGCIVFLCAFLCAQPQQYIIRRIMTDGLSLHLLLTIRFNAKMREIQSKKPSKQKAPVLALKDGEKVEKPIPPLSLFSMMSREMDEAKPSLSDGMSERPSFASNALSGRPSFASNVFSIRHSANHSPSHGVGSRQSYMHKSASQELVIPKIPNETPKASFGVGSRPSGVSISQELVVPESPTDNTKAALGLGLHQIYTDKCNSKEAVTPSENQPSLVSSEMNVGLTNLKSLTANEIENISPNP